MSAKRCLRAQSCKRRKSDFSDDVFNVLGSHHLTVVPLLFIHVSVQHSGMHAAIDFYALQLLKIKREEQPLPVKACFLRITTAVYTKLYRYM